MRKNEWQMTLKPGDKVLVTKNGDPLPQEAVVAKVTPSGRVKTEDGREFNADGARRGGPSWGNSWLRKWEPNAGAKARHYKLSTRFDHYPWQKFSLEALEKVEGLIKALEQAAAAELSGS